MAAMQPVDVRLLNAQDAFLIISQKFHPGEDNRYFPVRGRCSMLSHQTLSVIPSEAEGSAVRSGRLTFSGSIRHGF
jgi:hypothetical protein